jgi:hypothetical protein
MMFLADHGLTEQYFIALLTWALTGAQAVSTARLY